MSTELTRECPLPEIFSQDSPWRTKIDKLDPEPFSSRRTRAVFDILKQYSALAALDELPNTPIENVIERLVKLRTSINDHGGLAQIPYVSFDEFCFPIFEYEPTLGHQKNLKLRMYDGSRPIPNDLVETVEFNAELFAVDVPVATGKTIRPASPRNRGSDGAVILIDHRNNEAWDYWQASTSISEDGTSKGGGIEGREILESGGVALFSLVGPGAQPLGTTHRGSARASGLPYIGGLLVPEDLELDSSNGFENIQHAMAFTLPRHRYVPEPTETDPPEFVYPASSSETAEFTLNQYALVGGERIRLKSFEQIRGIPVEFPDGLDSNPCWEPRPKLRLEDMAPITRLFLTALQEYGAFLVDGSGSFGFAAEDWRTARVDLTDEQVSKLINENFSTSDRSETKWQAIIGKLNEQLCCQLFTDNEASAKKVGRFGLPFGLGKLLSHRNDPDFHCNFEVVPSPIEPERAY